MTDIDELIREADRWTTGHSDVETALLIGALAGALRERRDRIHRNTQAFLNDPESPARTGGYQ